MAMTWFQKIFTPERSGSYQWQNRPDQGGGEFTGEIEGVYEGDEQDLRFVPRANRGPGNTVGQMMPDATNATTGMGQTADQDIKDAITAMTSGADGGGMEDVGLSPMPSFTEDAGLLPSITAAMSQGFRSFPQRHAMRPGMSTGIFQGERGLRAANRGGTGSGMMHKVDPGSMRRPGGAMMTRAPSGYRGSGARPHFGFNPGAFNQGAKSTMQPRGFDLGSLWDILKNVGRTGGYLGALGHAGNIIDDRENVIAQRQGLRHSGPEPMYPDALNRSANYPRRLF